MCLVYIAVQHLRFNLNLLLNWVKVWARFSRGKFFHSGIIMPL
jgi:hypothetical protein